MFPYAIAYVLVNAKTENHLSVIAKLLENQASTNGSAKKPNRTSLPMEHTNVLQLGLEQALHNKDDKPSARNVWKNLSTLLRCVVANKIFCIYV